MSEAVVTVHVKLPGRAYPIDIGAGVLGGFGGRLRGRCDASRATVITDARVGPLYGDKAIRALEAGGFRPLLITVPEGDSSKSLDQARFIYDELARCRHDRAEPVIALGGGMVGDLAGFVAATWLRGVPFVQCPTTLEADVDASVGGKTAVNHPAGKNLIGVFHQPVLVCIDTDCLGTLDPRDFRAGLAESVKHGVIRDKAFFEWQESHHADILAQSPASLQELIQRNCENKAEVVVADERETDQRTVGRAALNFGHTVGHAIETQTRYRLRHGEAVALGMVVAMELAVCHCGFPDEDRRRVEALLEALGLPIRAPCPIDVADVLGRLGADKKVRNRMVRFVLPTRLGEVRWAEAIPPEDVDRAIGRITTS